MITLKKVNIIFAILSTACFHAMNNSLEASLYKSLVIFLINQGVSVNARNDDGSTTLHEVAHYGLLDVAQILINNRALVDVQDNNGNTPLHNASSSGHLEIAQALIRAGASVNMQNYNGNTPLHNAAFNGNINVIEALMSAKADTNKPNHVGKTPIQIAINNGNHAAAAYITTRQAFIVHDILRKTSNPARSALHVLPSYLFAQIAYLTMQEELYNPFPENYILKIATLSYAASTGDLRNVHHLIAQGTEVNGQDAKGLTPLHKAAYNGHLAIVNALIAAGAKIDITNCTGRTPLHMAAEHGHKEIVKTLIVNGANKNAQDYEDTTPLHYAAQNGHKKIVKALINSGAKLNMLNRRGKNPEQVARDGCYATIGTCIQQVQTVKKRIFEVGLTLASATHKRLGGHGIYTRPPESVVSTLPQDLLKQIALLATQEEHAEQDNAVKSLKRTQDNSCSCCTLL